MQAGLDMKELARHLGAMIADDALLDTEDVAAMLKVTPRYVSESYVKAPGFPRPIYLTGADGRKSKPRWIRRDVIEWIGRHAEGRPSRGGRPRKRIV